MEGGFKPGMVEKGVALKCAQAVAEKSGDARKAIDLLRVSGEIANQRRSKVTWDCVEAGLEVVEKDYVQEQLKSLSESYALILSYIAFMNLKQDKASTKDLYTLCREFKKKKNTSLEKLGERRVLDIVNDLETSGLVSTWNVSRGRYGYGKEMKVNLDPETILDYYKDKHKYFTIDITEKRGFSF